MTIKEKIEKRVKLHEDSKAILEAAKKDGRASLSAEEQEKFTVLNDEMVKLREEIKAEEKATTDFRAAEEAVLAEERALSESRGRKTGIPTATPSSGSRAVSRDRDLAFRAWALGKFARPEMLEAAQRCGLRVDLPYVDMAVRTTWGANGEEIRSFVAVPTKGDGDIDVRALEEQEERAMSVGTTTAGGNMVPNEMMQKFSEFQKYYGKLAARAQLVTTETGATLPWPTVDDTSNTGEVKSEGTSANAADPTIGVVNLGAFTLSSKRVPVSWELLQDSFVDVPSLLGRLLGTRLGRVKNTKFTKGAGTTEPMGIITAATTTATAAASSTNFTSDDVIALIHSVDLAYRGMPDSSLMAHDTIIKFLRQMKDGQGRYLWEPSVQLGQPDRLYGYAIEANNDMDSALTTGKKLLLFGNIPAGFVVRQAGATRFIRDESILVQQHQTYFEAWERGDSNLPDTGAVRVLTLS